MLIDFTVENFRSVKDRVTLSAVAAHRPARPSGDGPDAVARRLRVKQDEEIAPAFAIAGRDLRLLPVITIFGANASGKSNILLALDRFLTFVAHGDALIGSVRQWLIPFRLSSKTINAPTRFEIRSAHDGDIFTLIVELVVGRVLRERLEYIPAQSKRLVPRTLYDREWDTERAKYRWTNGADFGNEYLTIQEHVSQTSCFAQLLVSGIDVPQLASWTFWLRNRVGGTFADNERDEHRIVMSMLADPGIRPMLSDVSGFVRRFDTGIAEITISGALAAEDGRGQPAAWVIHVGDAGPVRWNIDEESTGTKRLFDISFKVLQCLGLGLPLLIDELGSNIHPLITREIVALFQSEVTNPRRAQLIFTSHDNTLQRDHVLRRDEIWFTQKRGDGSTDLYPLTSFRPRNDLALDRAYLDGRYGAVPILPITEDILPTYNAQTAMAEEVIGAR